jgi:adenosylcobinamide-GDP ribazoletransferase
MDLGGFFNREIPAFKLALQFLTRLPVTAAFSDAAMRQSPRWYPAVGLVVGAVAGLVFVLGNLLLTAQLAVFLAVAAAVIVTGALHEDGFADACDGLGGVRPKERVLEIMRDSRIGAYGVIGLIFMIGTKGLALSAMPATDYRPTPCECSPTSRSSVQCYSCPSRPYISGDSLRCCRPRKFPSTPNSRPPPQRA